MPDPNNLDNGDSNVAAADFFSTWDPTSMNAAARAIAARSVIPTGASSSYGSGSGHSRNARNSRGLGLNMNGELQPIPGSSGVSRPPAPGPSAQPNVELIAALPCQQSPENARLRNPMVEVHVDSVNHIGEGVGVQQQQAPCPQPQQSINPLQHISPEPQLQPIQEAIPPAQPIQPGQQNRMRGNDMQEAGPSLDGVSFYGNDAYVAEGSQRTPTRNMEFAGEGCLIRAFKICRGRGVVMGRWRMEYYPYPQSAQTPINATGHGINININPETDAFRMHPTT